jgi:hypothetical protein
MNYAWTDTVMKVKFLTTKLITAKIEHLITEIRTSFVYELSFARLHEFQNRTRIKQWNNGEIRSDGNSVRATEARVKIKLYSWLKESGSVVPADTVRTCSNEFLTFEVLCSTNQILVHTNTVTEQWIKINRARNNICILYNGVTFSFT